MGASENTVNAGLKVLLAEDDQINQMVITQFLNNRDMDIDQAENGVDALSLALENNYDLILMDVHMPEKDGIEVTQELRAQLGDPKKPIIVALTATTMSEDKEKCLEAGMNDFLSKPIRRQDIDDLIEKWF